MGGRTGTAHAAAHMAFRSGPQRQLAAAAGRGGRWRSGARGRATLRRDGSLQERLPHPQAATAQGRNQAGPGREEGAAACLFRVRGSGPPSARCARQAALRQWQRWQPEKGQACGKYLDEDASGVLGVEGNCDDCAWLSLTAPSSRFSCSR